jgi:thioredoxin-disulfide reductase
MVEKIDSDYDLVIVGGGCAGYPAAIYAARFNLKTLLIAKEKGGLITTTHLVENYPGFISLTGQELADNLEAHVKANNVPILNDIVTSVVKNDDGTFVVSTDLDELKINAKAVVLATGTKHKHLGAPGEKEFMHKGVSYCATCDGPFYKNQVVGIVGGGDSSAKEAMVLAQNSKKVFMFVRSKLRAEPINQTRIRALENVEIIEGVSVDEICGDETGVTSVKLNNGTSVDLTGLFIAIGHDPQSELAKSLDVELNNREEIIINKMSETNQEGVFAAGDVTDLPWKQGITGAAEGSLAGYSAFEYISKKFQ